MPEPEAAAGPYAQAAPLYHAAGWRGPIPLPFAKKKSPPGGWTGHNGAWPSYPDLQAWIDGPEGAGNIALRLDPHVIGLDVDDYGDKTGGSTVTTAEERWGPLPATWRSTSRDDGVSGIRMYRVPEGLAWPGELGADTEIIQTGHRYAVVWPSVHPEGRTYRWITPGGAVSTRPPAVDDLPLLPDRWVEELTQHVLAQDVARNNLTGTAAATWLAKRDSNGAAPCRRVAGALAAAVADLSGPGSAHVAARDHILRLIRLADQEHVGVLKAINQLHGHFINAVTDASRAGQIRDQREADGEYASLIVGAVNLITAAPTEQWGVDPCDNPLRGLIDARMPALSPVPEPATDAAAPAQPATPSLDDELRKRLIEQEVERQRAQRAARRILDEEEATAAFREPVWRSTLVEELAIPDEPVAYLVDEVLPTGGNVLLTAQYKAGKTTLVNHLTKCLADGDSFLGAFDVADRPGRVALWNYEVDERQYRRWLRSLGVEQPERVTVLNLRGYRLPLTAARIEEWIVRWLTERQITTWIVDPFARAFVGAGDSENDNTEVGRFLDTLDVIKHRAGVNELIMPAHTGRAVQEEGQERARGATRLDDWADVRWLVTKDEEDIRYFRATGRDVEIPEGKLEYDPVTRSLTMAMGQGRRVGGDRILSQTILSAASINPGIGLKALRDHCRFALGGAGNPAIDRVVKDLEEQGRLRVERGGIGVPTRHWLNDVRGLVEGPTRERYV